MRGGLLANKKKLFVIPPDTHTFSARPYPPPSSWQPNSIRLVATNFMFALVDIVDLSTIRGREHSGVLLFAGGRVDCGQLGHGVLSLSKLSTNTKRIFWEKEKAGAKSRLNVGHVDTLDAHFKSLAYNICGVNTTNIQPLSI